MKNGGLRASLAPAVLLLAAGASLSASPAFARDDTGAAKSGADASVTNVAHVANSQPKGAKALVTQDVYKDSVGDNHWAYEAVTDLQQKGILKGYPDGYFRGKRAMTRDEFAVALKRAMDSIHLMQGPAGPTGAAGPKGPAGPAGPPGVSAGQRAAISTFETEMEKSLKDLSTSLSDLNKKLDDVKDSEPHK